MVESVSCSMSTMAKPKHVLVMSFPAQGSCHSSPEKLSNCIADHGIKITFVNTKSIHAQVMAANPKLDEAPNQIKFVALLDGLKRLTRSERTLPKLLESISRVMLGHLQEKVKQQCNGNEDE